MRTLHLRGPHNPPEQHPQLIRHQSLNQIRHAQLNERSSHKKRRLSKAQQAFQRGIQALAQYIAREGHHRVPKAHAEEIAVEGEAASVVVKLGVWVSNTKSRRDKHAQDHLAALRELGVEWAEGCRCLRSEIRRYWPCKRSSFSEELAYLIHPI
ncbi:helicase associated domain-containing protein [Streptomyces werraensis]|uniref:helicase associated domain-containing protein n=1 Tax=Streptomyces werraensis TaxID=68284 RepID=UPI003F4C0582